MIDIVLKKVKSFFVKLRNPNLFLFTVLVNLKKIIPDKLYISLMFRFKLGRSLDWKNPKTFNEKMQILKIKNRKDIFTTMVDKYAVKAYVAEKIGSKYVIPCIGIWNKFEEIDFEKLPEQFVIKCTHDSGGGSLICRDKIKCNFNSHAERINKSLLNNYYWICREWPYKNITPRIIAEKYVKNPGREDLIVYKVFTFNGKPELIQVIQNDKTESESIDYFDCNWKLLDLKQNFENSKVHLEKPMELNEMLRLTSILAKGFPFLRVDWYIAEEGLLFSEFTFFSDAGFEKFKPVHWDLDLGKKILLE